LDGTGPSPRTLAQVAMHHRLGVVGVCEASVVVVVSSAHRRAALVRRQLLGIPRGYNRCEQRGAQDAVAFGIDELKARVPIWKKEVARLPLGVPNVYRCV
jgi:molybdopterin synthase catalytic subunit